MDAMKKENFMRAHPGQAFLSYQAMTGNACQQLRMRVASLFGLEQSATPLEVVRTLEAAPGQELGRVGEGSTVDLRALLEPAGISLSNVVYINWYRFDDIDRIAIEDLSMYWDDLWYPSSDDIDIFDDTCAWVLSVSHSGDLKLVLREK